MKITHIMASFTWNYGFWIRLEDGKETTITCEDLLKKVGLEELNRLRKVCGTNGLWGQWHEVPYGE